VPISGYLLIPLSKEIIIRRKILLYLYFIYITMLLILMVVHCYHQKLHWYNALIVFFAPVTTPYFIFTSVKKKRVLLISLFLSTFLAVLTAETFFYINLKEKIKYSDLPLVTGKLMELRDELRASTSKLDDSIYILKKSTVGVGHKQI